MALNPTVLWVFVGILLCGVEAVFPTAFVACVMGISAFVVALVAPIVPFNLQVALWMGLSLVFVLVSRRFVRRAPVANRLDATEAETLTEIPAGQTGRVLYEGNSWSARCEDSNLTIAPQQRVYVVGRRGTTLLVIPEHLLHS